MLEVSVGKVFFSNVSYKQEGDSVFTGNRIFSKEDESKPVLYAFTNLIANNLQLQVLFIF